MRAALLCLVVVAGCNERNPNYCPDQPENLCQPDAAQTKCEDADDCATVDNAHVCKLPAGVCVQCTAADKSACTGTAPLCDEASNVCTSCKQHTDCPSNVCMADGSCADEAMVAYVAPGGTGTCTKPAPCGTITAAVATPKTIIKVAAGMITADPATITINRAVTIVGEGADTATPTEIRRAGTGTQIIVRGPAANVTLSRLRVGAPMGGNGIEMTNDNGAPTLALDRVTIGGGGEQYGLVATSGTLTMIRSQILDCDDGALSLSNTRFTILHSFLRNNGAVDAPSSAVEISGSTAGDVFEYNTIAGNTTSEGLDTAMDCSGAAVIRNNIIYGNLDAVPASISHVTGNCTYSGNIIGPGGPPKAGNMDVDPLFVNMQPNFYKLMGTSPARGMATGTPPAMFAVDFDGEPRPNPVGSQADLGADEVP